MMSDAGVVAVACKFVNLFKRSMAALLSALLKQSYLSFKSETSVPVLVILIDEKSVICEGSFWMVGQLLAS